MLTQEDHNRAQRLYEAPRDAPLPKDDVQFLIKYIKEQNQNPVHQFKVKYAIFRKKSYKNAYVTFIIDSSYGSVRRSGVENYWDVIATRDLTDIEIEEEAENWGCAIKRFKVWYYKTIEDCIAADLLYEIDTPKKFIEKCIEKGYTIKKQ